MSNDGDLIATNVAEGIGTRLDLKYEHVMSYAKMLKITLGTGALLFAILFSQNIKTVYDIFATMISLGVFARLSFGSPMERRLTAESMQRLQEWLASEDTHSQESSHVGDSE